jgi:hypothetical protein
LLLPELISLPFFFALLPPSVKEGRGEIIWPLSFVPSLEKGRLGRVFYPKISPNLSFSKRGVEKTWEGFISPLCHPLHKRLETQRGS